MFKTIVDSKRGKVWVSDPIDGCLVEVADIEKDADTYLAWAETIGKFRNSTAPVVGKFAKLFQKKVKNLFDNQIKLR